MENAAVASLAELHRRVAAGAEIRQQLNVNLPLRCESSSYAGNKKKGGRRTRPADGPFAGARSSFLAAKR